MLLELCVVGPYRVRCTDIAITKDDSHHIMSTSEALSTLAGSVRQVNTVPITRFNTQGGKGSGGHEKLSGNTASEAREN